jgi:dihydrofolate reductase
MGKLVHLTNLSVDGYIEDDEGSFNWTEPDDELFAFLLELVRPLGSHLYGRRLYESMAVWETDPAVAAQSAATAEFARVWQAADKVVWSTTLGAVPTARTRVERTFDPDAVRALTASAPTDVLIGGAELAAQALAAGLVDELQLVVRPVVVGGGKPALPAGLRLDLELLDEQTVGARATYLRYRVLR